MDNADRRACHSLLPRHRAASWCRPWPQLFSGPPPNAQTVSAEASPATAALSYIVQAGTFGNLENARALLARILALAERLRVALQAETIDGRGLLNRVLVGNFAERAEAVACASPAAGVGHWRAGAAKHNSDLSSVGRRK